MLLRRRLKSQNSYNLNFIFKVLWRKENKLVSDEDAPENFIFMDEGSLLIENVDIDNRGRFVCLVSNAAGTARRVIKLDVQGNITMLKKYTFQKTKGFNKTHCYKHKNL